MTLRTCYLKMLWNTMKKKSWYGAASFLILFLAMPLTAMLSFQSANEIALYQYAAEELRHEQLEFAEYISGGNMGIGLLVMGLALLAAWSGLAWLHSKKQVDLYGSLPVRREILYGVDSVAALLWFLVAYACNLLLVFGVGVQKEICTVKAIKFGIQSIGLYLLIFLAMYFCAAMAMMMTGKVLTGILGTMVFLAIGPTILLLLTALPSLFLVSYVYNGGIFEQLACYLSPGVIGFEIIAEVGGCVRGYLDSGIQLLSLAALLLWIVGGAIGSVLLLKIRPAEGAEQSMVFPKTEGIIKGIILYPIAIGGGLFFWGIGGSQNWLWFGMIFGVLVLSILIEVIYHYDKKRIFEHKLSAGIALVTAALTICIFKYDILGIDSWIPKEDDVESVVLLSDHTCFNYPDGSYDSEDYLKNQMDRTSGECIYEVLPEGVELMQKYRAAENGDAEAEKYFWNTEWESVSVVFKMKNGTKIERNYRFSQETMESLRRELFEEKLYREAWFPIIMAEDDEYELASLEYEGVNLDDWTIKEKREFVNIYKEELKELDYTQVYGYADEWYYVDFVDSSGEWSSGSFPINKYFVKSMIYLNSKMN